MKSLRLLGFALLGSFFVSAGLHAADYGTPAGEMVLSDGATAADVQKIILESAIGRGWTVVSRDSEKVVIALTQEKWTSQLTLLYTARDVQIFSRSTRNGKPRLPETWIKFLKRDINTKHSLLVLNAKPAS